ncbi:MAG TPA: hypothetical protein VFW25_13835 [Silvibacterium sp.]|nr:hypothetical protein [Silvibacterium sp.]
MHRRSTLWFVIAAAWFVLLVLNMRHRDWNTIVIAIAVAGFLAAGVAYRRSETKAQRNRRLR